MPTQSKVKIKWVKMVNLRWVQSLMHSEWGTKRKRWVEFYKNCVEFTAKTFCSWTYETGKYSNTTTFWAEMFQILNFLTIWVPQVIYVKILDYRHKWIKVSKWRDFLVCHREGKSLLKVEKKWSNLFCCMVRPREPEIAWGYQIKILLKLVWERSSKKVLIWIKWNSSLRIEKERQDDLISIKIAISWQE